MGPPCLLEFITPQKISIFKAHRGSSKAHELIEANVDIQAISVISALEHYTLYTLRQTVRSEVPLNDTIKIEFWIYFIDTIQHNLLNV